MKINIEIDLQDLYPDSDACESIAGKVRKEIEDEVLRKVMATEEVRDIMDKAESEARKQVMDRLLERS